MSKGTRITKRWIDADVIMRACYNSFLTTGNKAYSEIISLVEAVPAADVAEVRHGRWDKKYRANFVCSVCNYWVKTTDEYGNTIDGDMDDYKYCPNCGSRMDLEDEVEE